jgi:hypothetical protein
VSHGFRVRRRRTPSHWPECGRVTVAVTEAHHSTWAGAVTAAESDSDRGAGLRRRLRRPESESEPESVTSHGSDSEPARLTRDHRAQAASDSDSESPPARPPGSRTRTVPGTARDSCHVGLSLSLRRLARAGARSPGRSPARRHAVTPGPGRVAILRARVPVPPRLLGPGASPGRPGLYVKPRSNVLMCIFHRHEIAIW